MVPLPKFWGPSLGKLCEWLFEDSSEIALAAATMKLRVGGFMFNFNHFERLIVCSILLGFALASGGCAGPLWNRRPDFPRHRESWEIPLFRPLTSDTLLVWGMAQSTGEDAPKGEVKSVGVPFLVDSGASGNIIGESLLDQLGVKRKTYRNVIVSGASGREKFWRGGLVPKLDFGGLILEDVAFLESEDSHVIGNTVLAAFPWEVDYDRGVLVINAPAWSENDVTASFKLAERYQSGVDSTEVVLDGHETLMLVDTGASNTSLDSSLARKIGLERRQLADDEKERYQSLYNRSTVHALYRVEHFKVGGIDMGELTMRPLPNMQLGPALNKKITGLIGMNFLSRYRFRVTASDSLELRPRRCVVETANERCSRWDWVPRCDERTGCVSAHLEKRDSGPVAVMAFEKAYDKAASFAFGCIDAQGALVPKTPIIEINSKGPMEAGQELTVDSFLTDGESGVESDELLEICGTLALVDVNPNMHAELDDSASAEVVLYYSAAGLGPRP